jgi:Ribonuclease G/E
MNKELFISSTPHETKVAVSEDDQLAEIYFERENEYTLAGSIYKGRVTRVLPGMQSAFVDIGLERDAFLYVTDFLEESDEQDDIETIPLPPPREQRSQRDFARSAAEPRGNGHDIQPHLVHPEEAPTGFAEPAEHAEAAAAGAAGATDTETDEEGARRWRGRRRRGRGRRGRGVETRGNGHDEASPEGAAAPAEAGDESSAEPQESTEFEDSENEPAEAAPQAEAESHEPREQRDREPRDFRGRDRDRDRDRGRGGRDFGRESYGPPAGFEPIVLPGEVWAAWRGDRIRSGNGSRSGSRTRVALA